MRPQVGNGIGVCTSPLTQPELADRSYEFIVYSQGAPLVETSPEHRTFTVDTIDPKPHLSGPLTQTADSAIGVTVSCGTQAAPPWLPQASACPAQPVSTSCARSSGRSPRSARSA